MLCLYLSQPTAPLHCLSYAPCFQHLWIQPPLWTELFILFIHPLTSKLITVKLHIDSWDFDFSSSPHFFYNNGMGTHHLIYIFYEKVSENMPAILIKLLHIKFNLHATAPSFPPAPLPLQLNISIFKSNLVCLVWLIWSVKNITFWPHFCNPLLTGFWFFLI